MVSVYLSIHPTMYTNYPPTPAFVSIDSFLTWTHNAKAADNIAKGQSLVWRVFHTDDMHC